MAELKRRRGRVTIRLAEHERDALLGVVTDLLPHVAASMADRLTAYENSDHQAEYDRWMRPEIELNRDADIEAIRHDLLSGEDMILLTEPQAYAWLRGLNHLRLAAANLAGADEDGWEERASELEQARPEFRMFLLLGYVEEELVVTLSN